MRIVETDLGELPVVQIPFRHLFELGDVFMNLVSQEGNRFDSTLAGGRDDGSQQVKVPFVGRPDNLDIILEQSLAVIFWVERRVVAAVEFCAGLLTAMIDRRPSPS